MPATQDLRLAARAIHRIPDMAGLQLRCDEGALWLTLDNDPRDVILEAGEAFTGTDHRPGIVYALAEARLSVRASRPGVMTPRPSLRDAHPA